MVILVVKQFREKKHLSKLVENVNSAVEMTSCLLQERDMRTHCVGSF